MNAEGRIAWLLEVKNRVGAGLRGALAEIKNFSSQVTGPGVTRGAGEWSKLVDQLTRASVIMGSIKAAGEGFKAISAGIKGEWEQVNAAIGRVPVLGDMYEMINAAAALTGDLAYTGHQRFREFNAQQDGEAPARRAREAALAEAHDAMRKLRDELGLAHYGGFEREIQQAMQERDAAAQKLRTKIAGGGLEGRLAGEQLELLDATHAARVARIRSNAEAEARAAWTKYIAEIRETFRRGVDDRRKLAREEDEAENRQHEEEKARGERIDRMRREYEDEQTRAFVESRQKAREAEQNQLRLAAARFDALHRTAPLTELTDSFKGVANQFQAGREFNRDILRAIDEMRRNVARMALNRGVAVVLR